MKAYSPKRDVIIAGQLLLAPVIMIAVAALEFDANRLIGTMDGWVFLGVFALVNGFLLWLWFGTGYQLDDKHLHIACGPLRKSVLVADIRYVRACHSLQSAYALSLSRLHVGVQKGQAVEEVLIAPAETKRFVQHLLRVQPSLVIHGGTA